MHYIYIFLSVFLAHRCSVCYTLSQFGVFMRNVSLSALKTVISVAGKLWSSRHQCPDLVAPLWAMFVCNREISWVFPARNAMGGMLLTRWQKPGLISVIMEMKGKAPIETSTKGESSWLLTGCMPQTVKPVSYFKQLKEHVGSSYGWLSLMKARNWQAFFHWFVIPRRGLC